MGSFTCLLISILPLLVQGHYQPSYSYQPTKIYHQKPVYSHKQVYQYEPQEPTYGYEPTCSTLSFCSSSCPSSYNSYNRRSWWIIIYTIMFSSFYISSNINLTSFNMLVRWGGKAGGHEPPLFPLLCHTLAFFLFWQTWATNISHSVPPYLVLLGRATFLNGTFWTFKCDFKKSSRVTQRSTTQTVFWILHKINILICTVITRKHYK